MNTTADKTTGWSRSFWAAVIVAVAGIAAWIYQLTAGMQVTGLDNGVAWGLYIAAFFVTVGGGAALLALAGISEFKYIISPEAKSKALLLAMTAFVVGGILITMDLGNPAQVFRLITSFSFQSMMVWDFWLLALCFVVALVFFLNVRKNGAGGKLTGVIAIAAAFFVVVAEGFMLSSMAAHSLWGSGMTVLSFLISAAVAGFALALLIMPQNEPVRRLLLAALVFSLVATLAEVLTGALTGNPETKAAMLFVLSGKAAPFLWGQVVIGLFAPLFLLFKRTQPVAAILLAVIGVIFEKTWLLAAGQAERWLQESFSVYFPSAIEYITVIGAAAIGVVLFTLALHFLGVKSSHASQNQSGSVLQA